MSKFISVSILLGASLLLAGCGRSKAELMKEGAVCNGIASTFFTSGDVTGRIARSMSASDRPLPVYEAAVKSNKALQKLESEKILTKEQIKENFDLGVAIANKISTYEELKKRFDECEKTIAELAKIAGTD